jgi:autotransporter passenger strand-loop-strand repeat protein
MTDLVITSGVISSGLAPSDGDTVSVTSGGLANGTEIGNGGQQFVYFSGFASGTEIDSGGIELVSSGGTTTGTTVAAGGTEYVYSGGVASGLMIASGGYAVLAPDADASDTTVDNGGTLVVLPGASTTDTTSLAGADIVSTGTVVVGGGQVISLGDTNGAQVGGGDTEYVLNGGHATATTVQFGGLEAIYSGGVASGATIGVAGQDSIYSGGVASDTIVQFVGDEFVFASGSALFTTISGGTQEIQGGFASGTTVSNGGVQQVALDGKAVGDIVSSGGVVSVTLGATTGTQLQNGGSEYVVGGASAVDTTISSGGTLLVYSGSIVSGTVMLESGSIDLADVTYSSGGSADFDAATNTLTVHEGGQDYTEHLSGDYTGEYFHLSQDDSGNTLVTEEGTPCYCRGTRILTDHGEMPVETLRIGDRLITMSGRARPIRWIGTRSYSGRFAAGNKDVLPILIMQNALGTNVPERDLWVSPLHAMFLDGVLIPAWALINGASIVQTARVDNVEYFHLELETHDVLIAEGALAESFLDDHSRGMFHNAATYREIYPDTPPAPARYCAPRVEDGEIVQSVRGRIDARVGVQHDGHSARFGAP